VKTRPYIGEIYLVGAFRQYQLEHGVPKAQVYSTTMYVLAGLLAVGFVCNLLVSPVAEKHVMTPQQIAELDATVGTASSTPMATERSSSTPSPTWLVAAAWLGVGVPLAWGVWATLQKAVILFGF
jgi:hypothetical protein